MPVQKLLFLAVVATAFLVVAGAPGQGKKGPSKDTNGTTANDNTNYDCNNNINDPCRNGGICVLGVGVSGASSVYTCQCFGYFGNKCQFELDECAAGTANCKAGTTCVNTLGSYNCVDINECLSNPCVNGGTCINGDNQYTCDCNTAPGWQGVNCDIDINECLSSPCVNGGTCINGQNRWDCDCSTAPGWQGITCAVDINECLSSPCVNGGICINGQNRYTCDCTPAPGWTGTNCADVKLCCGSIPNFGFEEGTDGACPTYWTCSGGPIKASAASGTQCGTAGGASATGFLGSAYGRVGCDSSIGGTMRSPSFVIPANADRLMFYRSGGAAQGSGVSIINANTGVEVCVNKDSSKNQNLMYPDFCDNLSPAAGQTVYIQVKDTSTANPWGAVYVDQFIMQTAASKGPSGGTTGGRDTIPVCSQNICPGFLKF